MNLLLFRPDEILDASAARITGPRARHLLHVLKVGADDRIKVGLPDGPIGTARVRAIRDDAVFLEHDLDAALPSADPPPLFDVLLALPRPKVLARLLQDLAALGAGRIVVCRSWRVEKSYFQTEILAPERARELLLLGLEQGMGTRLPELRVEPLFRPFVEDRLDALAPARRFLADPAATRGADRLHLRPDERFMIAIGPEGGFIPFERDLLVAGGFEAIELGARILRVEAALLRALGVLDRCRS